MRDGGRREAMRCWADRAFVRRLRVVQGKCNADDVGSNQSYGRMPLGANERASERVWLLFRLG